MYFLFGISLMLALLLVLNLLISAAMTVLWRVSAPFAQSLTARRQAQIVFALRTFPFIAALSMISVFLLPSYLLFEPQSSKEIVTFKLALIASASMIGVGIAAFRVFGTWWRTRRLIADWLKNAELIRVEIAPVPVYRIVHTFPVIAVVGILRPRLFVARQIFEMLGEAEFQAAIRHECGHLAARDNFKRTLMRVCRDLFVLPFGKSLDRVWSANAEAAADEYAARNGGKATALNLASALVKIARIAPRNSKPAMPAGAFLIEANIADIDRRVHQLLKLTETKLNFLENQRNKFENLFWVFAVLSFALIILFAANYGVLRQVHFLMEFAARILQ